jgi:hypothetical protein
MGKNGRYTLTVRHGSEVSRQRLGTLEGAVEELRRQAEEIRSEGTLKGVSAIRDFEPGQRVHARLEISTGGMLRSREAGVDVMGDGSMVPFRGGIRRTELQPAEGQGVFDAISETLGGQR